MMIHDRASQLRKSIPAAISELSEALRLQTSGQGSAHLREDHLNRTKAAAKEMRLLAQSLAAAAHVANRMLDPPRPTSQPFDPSRMLVGNPRPGSPPLGTALAATCAEPPE